MNRNIFFKVFNGYIVIILFFIFFIFFISTKIIHDYYINEIFENIYDISKIIKYAIEKNPEKFIKNNLSELQYFSKELKKRITLVNKDGKVLFDSDENINIMDNHKDRYEINEAFNGKIGKTIRYSNTKKINMLYVAIPIYDKDKNIIYALRCAYPLYDINVFINKLRYKVLFFSSFVFLLSLIIAYFFSLKVSKTIKSLLNAFKLVSDGNFDTRIMDADYKEFFSIAENFNLMVKNIHNLFIKIEEQKQKLDLIIKSLGDGLILLNKEGKINIFNENFKKLAKINENITNRYFWEIIREPLLIELVKKVQNTKSGLNSEIEIYNKIYWVNISYLKVTEEIIIIFHNITKIKNLEKVKRDFVTNVSHELRTPLTSIKGFIETLIEETEDSNHLKYLDIISRNTDRLINIVNDLLILSELENNKFTLKIEETDIKELIIDILKIFENKFKLKGLSLDYNFPEKEIKINCDSFRISQVLINIIENSYKYTEEGGVKINLKENEDNTIEIEISDTGIGISSKDLGRIFERFYVVDKSRSRKTGGTGLGLSIVKHIINLHKGRINIESTLMKGTTVKIILPK